MNRNELGILEATGNVLREHMAEVKAELARTDRAFTLVATVESLRVKESLDGLRRWVQAVSYEKSKVVEVRAPAPPWLALLDAKGGAK